MVLYWGLLILVGIVLLQIDRAAALDSDQSDTVISQEPTPTLHHVVDNQDAEEQQEPSLPTASPTVDLPLVDEAQSDAVLEPTPTATPIQIVVLQPTPTATPIQVKVAVSAKVSEPEPADLPLEKLVWLDDPFIVTHYTFAMEADPIYANDELISAPGLDPNDKLRAGFLFGGRGIIQQGTGLTTDGRYITIDWERSIYSPDDLSANEWYFTYGVGRGVIPWKTVAANSVNLPPGTKIVIDYYRDKGVFIVNDTGADLVENQVDIFIGPLTIGEADQYGRIKARIAIVEDDYVPQSAASN